MSNLTNIQKTETRAKTRIAARERLQAAWARHHSERSDDTWREVLTAQQWFDEVYDS